MSTGISSGTQQTEPKGRGRTGRENRAPTSKDLAGRVDGTGVATAHRFEDETAPAIHEQLARLQFAEKKIPMRGKRVLDFGCGSGYNSYFVSERQEPSEVVGIDLMEDCIAYCVEHYSTDKTRFEVQDCLVHNPELGVFDVVLSCEVLEHVLEQRQFLNVIGKSLAPGGTAFVSTPNRAIFSLTKSHSFNNTTHVKELFFREFEALIAESFRSYTLYSQVHKGAWHDAYVNQLSVSNFLYALRYEMFGDSLKGKLAREAAKRLLVKPLAKRQAATYPNVRKRRYSDFGFVEGFDDFGVWFVAICSDPI